MSLDAPVRSSAPIESVDDLVEWFVEGEKPNGPMRIGIETEKLGVFADGRPVPLTGERSISTVMRGLAERTGGELLVEQGVPMGVQLAGASIALEPGGQLELSGAPDTRLRALGEEIKEHLTHLEALSEPLGITWIASGYRPWGPRSEVPWLPRYRYQLMRERLPGQLAHEMMQMTSSVQMNYDFTSEADLAEKLRVATLVSPLTAAACAASPLTDGKPNGFKSFRYHIWSDVDRSRCGLVPVMYENFTYRRYVEWALDVPLLFVRRGGNYVDPKGLTLRDVWRDGFEGEPASMQDFVDLLSTLFPEIRVKRVIEVRGADAVDQATTLALAALWTGLFYDPESRRDAARFISPSFDALVAFQSDVARRALDATLDGHSARDLFAQVLQLARSGLERRFARGESENESGLLAPLERIVDEGLTPADHILALAQRTGGDIPTLINEMKYRANAGYELS